ncbi:MAG: hypothetical protein WC655_26775 [Candidatus Hydrogenedentales bacterium]|jgi:hypothetical protein
MSNYPNGFPNGVQIRGVPVLNSYAGNVFWVNSANGSNGNKGTRERPFTTLDYAIGRCTANNGDLILVAPNHAETITGAGGIAHDVAGVSVIGMGVGNQRPRFLMDAGTTVTYAISAADAYVGNIVFASGHADVVTCFDVTGVYAHIDGCMFVDNVANENFLSAISATGAANTADGLKVTNNRFMSADAATLGFIMTTDDVEFLEATDNVVVSEGTGLATLMTVATGKDVRGIRVLRNYLSSKATAGNLAWSNDTASPNNSGIIAHNRCRHADVTAGHTMGAVGGCGFFDNLSASTDAVSGFVLPAIDVDL